jgi:hypothetical protein
MRAPGRGCRRGCARQSVAALRRIRNNAYKETADRLLDSAVRRFTIAHELGHYVLKHPSLSFAEMCVPVARGHQLTEERDAEVEANAFASELLMPEHLVQPACKVMRASLDPALRIAYTFGVSARASAIRFTELTDAPCAVVLSERGVVRWTAHSATFLQPITTGRPIDPRSVAWAYFEDGTLSLEMQLVPAAAWLDAAVEVRLVEHSIASHERGTVLTMLWVPPERPMDLAILGFSTRALR